MMLYLSRSLSEMMNATMEPLSIRRPKPLNGAAHERLFKRLFRKKACFAREPSGLELERVEDRDARRDSRLHR